MIFDKLTHRFELKFWDIVIQIAEEEGFLMKLIKESQENKRSRFGTFLLLILVWAAVGFTVGLVFGKLLTLIQYF